MMSIRTYTDKRASVSCVYPDIVAVPSHFFVSLFGLFIDILVSVNFDVYHRLFRKHVSVVSSFKSGVRVRKTSTRAPGAKIMMSRHKKCTAKSGKALHSVVIQKQPTTTNCDFLGNFRNDRALDQSDQNTNKYMCCLFHQAD